MIRLWWLVTHGHHLAVTIYFHVAPSPGRHSGQHVKSVNQYKYLRIYWMLSSQMTKTFRDNCDENIVQQTSCEPLFPDVQMQIKRYFFVPFARPCLHHKYGERVLVVMTHQVQCNIRTFEALLRKNMDLFLEGCRRSNNVWLPALTQSDCLYSSLFFEHYNRTLLCDWVLEHCSVCSFVGVHVTMQSYFT